MDKNAIKKYAVWARKELIARVTQKAEQYEITEKKITPADADSIGGRVLTAAEKKQRQALIAKIKQNGFEQVMEEVAYTWFNRFTALRFMEVNNYLPSHTKVFTNENGEFKPQILADAIQLDLEGLNMDKVFELKDANKTEELYKYLLITQCNALSGILPRMFQRLSDYTELLLPDYLLREGSVIEQMIALIPEEDWTDQVQIIGWLYQFYNIETFDSIFDGDMSRKKVTKELLPAATEIFTPDWAVEFMVDNSLGRLWLDNHSNTELKSKWKYYLEDVDQDEEVEKKINQIKTSYADLKPEEILCIDPCMGSGHILCYMFDVLIKIYEDYGYITREAVRCIIEKNLWGLDIDERAAQLAYFAVMMKARQYDRRFFSKCVQPHVYVIKESKEFSEDIIRLLDSEGEVAKAIIEGLKDAKEYGSLLRLNIRIEQVGALKEKIEEILEASMNGNIVDQLNATMLKDGLLPLVEIAETLVQKYHIAVTNPPYLGNSRMNSNLSDFIKKNYPDEKADLAIAMLNRITWGFTKKNGYSSGISTVSWMYLKSFEQFRRKMISDSNFICLTDYGTELFDGKIGHLPIASWVTRNCTMDQNIHSVRLVDFCYSRRDEKGPEFFNSENHYVAHQTDFTKIPGEPIAYWASNSKIAAFENGILIDDIASVKIGMGTGKNEVFVREWWEIPFDEIDFSLKKFEDLEDSNGVYFPYNKGGDYRRWYGNLQEVVWYNEAGRKKMFSMSGHRENGGRDGYFKKGITWNFIGTSKFGVRLMPTGCLFDVAGSALFTSDEYLYYLLGFLSSSVCNEILKILNPTVNYQAGNIKSLPVIKDREDEIKSIVLENVDIAKHDWDSFETSWDFQQHPLLCKASTIAEAFDQWQAECDNRFNQLKANEEELNRIFIDIYGLQYELTPEVEDKDVTVRKADFGRDIRSFISYAVGCMFGRYSIYKEGLIYAGGKWNYNDYENMAWIAEGKPEVLSFYSKTHFFPDQDNIIPICDDEYFVDDIVHKFIELVSVVYGTENLHENIKFIADALGGKGQPKDVIRNYFLNDFYKDHCKIYQKRPIYWLFDSGKKNGFKALIYMHRYQSDTIARIRTDYVHEQQSRYRTAMADLEKRIDNVAAGERVKLNKELNKLQAQAEEIRVYEEKIHHLADQMISIDLDDGVKHNYAIFKDVLAKIK